MGLWTVTWSKKFFFHFLRLKITKFQNDLAEYFETDLKNDEIRLRFLLVMWALYTITYNTQITGVLTSFKEEYIFYYLILTIYII